LLRAHRARMENSCTAAFGATCVSVIKAHTPKDE
jgi:hypothetical protein